MRLRTHCRMDGRVGLGAEWPPDSWGGRGAGDWGNGRGMQGSGVPLTGAGVWRLGKTGLGVQEVGAAGGMGLGHGGLGFVIHRCKRG